MRSSGSQWVSSDIEFTLFDILQLYRNRVDSRLCIVNVTGAMSCQICRPVLRLRNFIFPIQSHLAFVLRSSRPTTNPWYKPTLSCTKSKFSSEDRDGRSAVVRSNGCKNIQAHDFIRDDILCRPQALMSLRHTTLLSLILIGKEVRRVIFVSLAR